MTIDRRLVDLGVVAAVAVTMTLTIGVAEEEGSREPNLLAYLLGLAVAALLLARRQWPMGVLVGSVGLLFIYFSRDYPAFSPAVPLAVASYSAAAAGRLVPAAAIVGGTLLVGAVWQTVGEGGSVATVLGRSTLTDAALLAAVLMLGEAVRSRRALAEEEAGRRVQEERLRIARELHDVMAHTVAALNVQAAVAADALDDDPEAARASLRTIRAEGRRAVDELRSAVGALRDAPAPGLTKLDALVGVAERAGVAVEVSVAGAARPLPAGVDVAAYRIVQESLTNVVRHARATAARVLVRYDPGAVVLEVTDDGRGAGGAGGDGHGLVGMRERAATVGGTLEAGPAPGGGFRVQAELPT